MQVATNAHPSPWRYRGYRLLSFLSLPIASSVSIRRINPNSSNPSIPFSLVNLRTSLRGRDNEGCDGLTATTSCRGKIRSWCAISPRRIGPPLPSPDRGVTNELTSAIHQIDRSGNGCALCETWRLRGDFIIESYIGITCDTIERW